MRSDDIIILAIAAGAAWFIVRQAKAGTQAASVAPATMSSESLAWYLNDIYAKLNAQYA